MGEQLLALLIAVVAGSGASFVTSYLARPKTKADADAVTKTAEVAVSSDAREWSKFWSDKAETAESKANSAEKRVGELEVHLDEVTTILVKHIRTLEDLVRTDGHPVPPMPDLPRLHHES